VDPDAVELRILGCLIEKHRTTPDAYPLSLNSLRLACNQTTNRDPVVGYDEPTIRDGLTRLSNRGWVRLASGQGSRAVKYRHLFDEALDLSAAEMSLLAVLMLRGPQTPGELKQRTERLHAFESLPQLEETLEGLIGRELVARLPRRPGQKEQRYAQLLGESAAEQPMVLERGDRDASATGADSGLAARLAALERRVEQLERAARPAQPL
jgi:uncharacterized protein